jgi:hypothetical protein
MFMFSKVYFWRRGMQIIIIIIITLQRDQGQLFEISGSHSG